MSNQKKANFRKLLLDIVKVVAGFIAGLIQDVI